MSTPADRPDVSLVIDHETIALVSTGRVAAVVRELARQAREAPFAVEVLVPETSDIGDDELAGLTVRRFPAAPDAHYYDVKNAGARAATGSVIVFADSDVLPLDGWLDNLVGALDDPAVEAAVGNSIIRPVSRVTDKAFAAAGWLPAHEADVRRQIIAHTFAVRPSTFLPDGFPDIGCRYRGADTDLNRTWTERGVRMEVALDAHAQHPPPEHPIRRAMWDGHDQQIEQRRTGTAFAPFLARVVGHQLLVGSVRVVRHRRAVGLRPSQLPVALACNAREAFARGAGFTLARYAHRHLHRWVPQ